MAGKRGQEHKIKITSTGSAGSATGTGTTEDLVWGWIESLYLDYNASAPNTTDLSCAEATAPARTLFTLANTNTDVVKYPRVAVQDNVGAAATYDGTHAIVEKVYVAGKKLTFTLAQTDAIVDDIVIYLVTSE